jgi:hypothetical protein
MDLTTTSQAFGHSPDLGDIPSDIPPPPPDNGQWPEPPPPPPPDDGQWPVQAQPLDLGALMRSLEGTQAQGAGPDADVHDVDMYDPDEPVFVRTERDNDYATGKKIPLHPLLSQHLDLGRPKRTADVDAFQAAADDLYLEGIERERRSESFVSWHSSVYNGFCSRACTFVNARGYCVSISYQFCRTSYPTQTPHQIAAARGVYAGDIMARMVAVLVHPSGQVLGHHVAVTMLHNGPVLPLATALGDGTVPRPMPPQSLESDMTLMPGQMFAHYQYRIRPTQGPGRTGEPLHQHDSASVSVQAVSASRSAHSTFEVAVHFEHHEGRGLVGKVLIHEHRFSLPNVLVSLGVKTPTELAGTHFRCTHVPRGTVVRVLTPTTTEQVPVDVLGRLFVHCARVVVRPPSKRNSATAATTAPAVEPAPQPLRDRWSHSELPDRVDVDLVVRTLCWMAEMSLVEKLRRTGAIGKETPLPRSSMSGAPLSIREWRRGVTHMVSLGHYCSRDIERASYAAIKPIVEAMDEDAVLDNFAQQSADANAACSVGPAVPKRRAKRASRAPCTATGRDHVCTPFYVWVNARTYAVPMDAPACVFCRSPRPLIVRISERDAPTMRCDVCDYAVDPDRPWFVATNDTLVADGFVAPDYAPARSFIVAARCTSNGPNTAPTLPQAVGIAESGFCCSEQCCIVKTDTLVRAHAVPEADFALFNTRCLAWQRTVFNGAARANAPLRVPLSTKPGAIEQLLDSCIATMGATIGERGSLNTDRQCAGAAWGRFAGPRLVGPSGTNARVGVSLDNHGVNAYATDCLKKNSTTNTSNHKAAQVSPDAHGFLDCIATVGSSEGVNRSAMSGSNAASFEFMGMPRCWILDALTENQIPWRSAAARPGVTTAPGAFWAGADEADVCDVTGAPIAVVSLADVERVLEMARTSPWCPQGISASVHVGHHSYQPSTPQEWAALLARTPDTHDDIARGRVALWAPKIYFRQTVLGLLSVEGERVSDLWHLAQARQTPPLDEALRLGLVRAISPVERAVRHLCIRPDITMLVNEVVQRSGPEGLNTLAGIRLCCGLSKFAAHTTNRVATVGSAPGTRCTNGFVQTSHPQPHRNSDPLIYRRGLVGRVQRLQEQLLERNATRLSPDHPRQGALAMPLYCWVSGGGCVTAEDACCISEQFLNSRGRITSVAPFRFSIRDGAPDDVIAINRVVAPGDTLMSVQGVPVVAPSTMKGRITHVKITAATAVFHVETIVPIKKSRKITLSLGGGQKTEVSKPFDAYAFDLTPPSKDHPHPDVLVDWLCNRRLATPFYTDHYEAIMHVYANDPAARARHLTPDGLPKQTPMRVRQVDGTVITVMRDMLLLPLFPQTQSADNMSCVCPGYGLPSIIDDDIVDVTNAQNGGAVESHEGAPVCPNPSCRIIAPPVSHAPPHAMPQSVNKRVRELKRSTKVHDHLQQRAAKDEIMTRNPAAFRLAVGVLWKMFTAVASNVAPGQQPVAVRGMVAYALQQRRQLLEENLAQQNPALLTMFNDAFRNANSYKVPTRRRQVNINQYRAK